MIKSFSLKSAALLLAAVCLLSVVGCGKIEPSPTDSVGTEVSSASVVSSSTASDTQKTTDSSSASDPETNPTTDPATDPITDPQKTFSLSLVRPVVKNGKYVYNPYLLSEEAIEAYGEGFAECYYGFVRAYLNYETVCPCQSEDDAMMLDMVLSYECPFFAQNDLDFSWTDYDYDEHTISWSYVVSRADLRKRIDAVAAEMQTYLDLVTPEMKENRKVQTLYHAFCPKMTYNYEMMNSREHVEASWVLLNRNGICVNFSYCFGQMLGQVGVFSTTMSGSTKDGEGHAWNYVRVNGKFYYFDTTFELSFKQGSAYMYYGMTEAERSQDVRLSTASPSRYGATLPKTPDSHLNVG